MTSASTHARILLAAIIPDRADRLEHALRELTPVHFADPMLRNLFLMLERFSDITSDVMTRQALADMLAATRLDAGTAAAYTETYDELAQRRIDDASFRWSMLQLRELAAERSTKQALAEGMEILTRGLADGKGDTVQGHLSAREHIMNKFTDIERSLHKQEAPEGDIRDEANAILAEYDAQAALRASGRATGIQFGVRALDDKVGGLYPGELCLVVAYTSDGKTSLCTQLAWSAVVEQGKNVLFMTTETPREQVRRRMIARHSCLPRFGDGEGINSRDIRHGTLTGEDRRRLDAVVRDLADNGDYGRSYICQVPRGASMKYVENKAMRIHKQMRVDLIVMDYLALLQPERKRTTDREESANTLKSAKLLTTTFSDGAGVPFVSPWQVSRSARIEAERLGHYKLDSTSETSETSNSTDLMIGLLAPLDNEQRRAKVKLQLMKHRDGQKANAMEAMVDYATCKFTSEFQQSMSMDEVFDPIANFLP